MSFPSTHPCGVRLIIDGDVNAVVSVSIHAPLRGATLRMPCYILYRYRFNPRTPAGCDPPDAADRTAATRVSIHAPLRGATILPQVSISHLKVSIHAPLRGATIPLVFVDARGYVSIHAPLRGATVRAFVDHALKGGFNPRTPAGCDNEDIHCWKWKCSCFNPRTPAGCDGIGPETPPSLRSVSIHAPLRGATGNSGGAPHFAAPFQSTHPCGVRPGAFVPMKGGFNVSIHAPLRGATSAGQSGLFNRRGFNPRTPAGCDIGSGVRIFQL